MKCKPLPIGIEFFSSMIKQDYYYVDKTGMIKELLENKGSVNLFTRPRRFGKTLNMDMLKCFFEIGTDKSLFDGLDISKERKLCEEYMGKHPVISLSLKQVQGLDFQKAQELFWGLIKREAARFDYLQDSTVLKPRDKQVMMDYSMGIGVLEDSVLNMSRILFEQHGQKVIILIDEYDVPLQKAEQNGYYKEMTSFISQLFGSSMKINPFMEFAVVTGCLRVVKESIFTGFNNPKMHTILDERYDEWFGFTDAEVQEMLTYYGQEDKYALTREWYDGYLFGKTHVYCPWDVINWCDKLKNTTDESPENYWANSSDNQMIHRFADKAEGSTKAELEQLLEGKSIWKKLKMELTYNDLDKSIDNIWSVLFTTGYLTHKGRNEANEYELIIPNQEILNLFREMLDEWFREKILGNEEKMKSFNVALVSADAEQIERCIRANLGRSISFLDGGRQEQKESFYHGMLLGMLQMRDGWTTVSNREAGEGRPDIITYSDWEDKAFIFELKYVKTYEDMEAAAGKALEQIRDMDYDRFFETGISKEVIHVGIAFCKKRCRVFVEKKCG